MSEEEEPRCDDCGEETDLLTPVTTSDGLHFLVCQDCEEEYDIVSPF